MATNTATCIFADCCGVRCHREHVQQEQGLKQSLVNYHQHTHTHIHTLATKPHCTLYDGAIASLGLTSCKDLQVNS